MPGPVPPKCPAAASGFSASILRPKGARAAICSFRGVCCSRISNICSSSSNWLSSFNCGLISNKAALARKAKFKCSKKLSSLMLSFKNQSCVRLDRLRRRGASLMQYPSARRSLRGGRPPQNQLSPEHPAPATISNFPSTAALLATRPR